MSIKTGKPSQSRKSHPQESKALRVDLTFDADLNGSGQHAAESLARQLVARGLAVRQVVLPGAHDPNSFFVDGADARQFQLLLEAARP